MTHTIEVRTANPYQVVVGHGLFDQVVAHLPTSARRVAVVKESSAPTAPATASATSRA